jgi:hypothetical protein
VPDQVDHIHHTTAEAMRMKPSNGSRKAQLWSPHPRFDEHTHTLQGSSHRSARNEVLRSPRFGAKDRRQPEGMKFASEAWGTQFLRRFWLLDDMRLLSGERIPDLKRDELLNTLPIQPPSYESIKLGTDAHAK